MMMTETSQEESVSVCMLVTGKIGYALAAREAITSFLQNTDFDLYVTAEEALVPLLPLSERVHINLSDHGQSQHRADRFLAKFEALAWCLDQTNSTLIIQADVDAALLRRLEAGDVKAALGAYRMGMVVQTGIIGSNMTSGDFLDHFRDHAIAYIDATANVPTLDTFRYFNSGLVIAHADELKEFLGWAEDRRRTLPDTHVIGEHMITDQDYFQVWANIVCPERCLALPWYWNHCNHWDEDFIKPGALVAHFSNFCNGPTVETVLAMHVLGADAAAVESANRPLEPKLRDLAYVIVTYNSSKVLQYCIDALAGRGSDIIIVDNGSIDGTLDVAANDKVKIIKNETNEGFGAAANRGASATDAEYICFLNPDCLVTEVAVEEALAALRENPEAVAVPKYIDLTGTMTPGRQPGYSRMKLVADLLENNGMARQARRLKRLPNYDQESWSWPHGACLFSRRETFNGLGGFDNKYFCYMEDVAIGYEMHRRGIAIIQLDTVAIHFGQHGSDIPSAARIAMIDEARLLFARLHFGPTFAAALGALRWTLQRYLDAKILLRPWRRRPGKARA